ncbi:MAG: cytidine deaminase [Treponemataceae bacterium]|nr:cytidine deaminase [Treponemataceae bacterium]
MAQISDELIALYRAAVQAAAQSYSPYSHFPVGAAILTADGAVYTGTNVENRSFGLTNCAERTAAFKAVSDGKRSFAAVAIATPRSEYPVGPCGACRQVLTEFAGGDVPVVFGPDEAGAQVRTLGELYPCDSLHELASER